MPQRRHLHVDEVDQEEGGAARLRAGEGGDLPAMIKVQRQKGRKRRVAPATMHGIRIVETASEQAHPGQASPPMQVTHGSSLDTTLNRSSMVHGCESPR
eukprot:scaffold1500_cov398-Prasinococcus_capsulatus_cf.AAC.21